MIRFEAPSDDAKIKAVRRACRNAMAIPSHRKKILK